MPNDDGRCATCGRELADDPDDDPTGRERDREREDDFVLIDLFDGNLDGHLG
jgi:hypothetical protein